MASPLMSEHEDNVKYLRARKRWFAALNSEWEAFLETIPKNYSDEFPIEAKDKTLVFRLFGKDCFAKLQHDLETGYIVYGVIERREGGVIEVPYFAAKLSSDGNTDYGHTTATGTDARIHFAALRELSKKAFPAPSVK